MQKLITDKRLRYGNSLCTLTPKHLYGPLLKKIHILHLQNIFTYIPQVYRRHIFYMEKQQNRSRKFFKRVNAKHPSIKFEYEISKERISFLDTETYIKSNKLHTNILKENRPPNLS